MPQDGEETSRNSTGDGFMGVSERSGTFYHVLPVMEDAVPA